MDWMKNLINNRRKAQTDRMKPINDADRVDQQLIKTYSEINGLDVIEELLLFKGIEIAGANRVVHKKYLDDTALALYNLKVNATNRLYVGLHLDRFYLRSGLICDSGRIRVPNEIYNRVKKLNDSYKTDQNQIED